MLTPKAADEQQPIVVGCSTDNWNTDSWNTDSSLGLLERLEPPRAAGLPAACTRRDGDATLSSHAAIAPRNSPMKSSPSAPTKVESWLARPVISRSLYETQATATGPGAYTYARKHPAKAAPAPRPWTQRRARPPLKIQIRVRSEWVQIGLQIKSVFTVFSHLQNEAQAAPTAWIWAGMHSGMVYEGIGTTWDHQESSLAKLTFDRRPPRELQTAAGTVFTALLRCETL